MRKSPAHPHRHHSFVLYGVCQDEAIRADQLDDVTVTVMIL